MAASSVDTVSQASKKPANDKAGFEGLTPNIGLLKPGVLDIVRDRWVYLGISLLLLVPGIFYIITNWLNPDIQAPVRLGIDFSGGTMLEYGFHKKITEEDLPAITTIFEDKGYHGAIVQIQKPRAGINDDETIDNKAALASSGKATSNKTVDQNTDAAVTPEQPTKAATTNPKDGSKLAASAQRKPDAIPTPAPAKNITLETTTDPMGSNATTVQTAGQISTIVYIRSKQLAGNDQQVIHKAMTDKFGDNTLLQNYSIGPSLANELLQNGLLALGLAYLLIIGYLTFRFEFDYALCAIISLVHDALFVFGVFAILGHFFNTEIDSMFITALLTVVGFSVHDTIVVYDRLRENSRVYFTKKLPFAVIANLSINQTLVRSISTSVTVLLTLLALYLFGGETTKDFIFACLVGIAVGTYSSIFVASSLLAWVREGREKQRTRPA